MYINGKFYNYKYFVYDGCHKIYLIHKKDFKQIKAKGYDKSDIHSISLLKTTYVHSCDLRFIARWDDLDDVIVPQCADPDLVIFGKLSPWKRTALSDNDFNILEKCAEDAFRHSENWFYEEYFKRKTIDYVDLCDLVDVWHETPHKDSDIDLIGAEFDNSRIREIWLNQKREA